MLSSAKGALEGPQILLLSLIFLGLTGCDQVVQRLSNKPSTHPFLVAPKPPEKSSEESPKRNNTQKKADEKADETAPSSISKLDEKSINPSLPTVGAEKHKKQVTNGVKAQTSNNNRKSKLDTRETKNSEEKSLATDEVGPSGVKTGNVSREY